MNAVYFYLYMQVTGKGNDGIDNDTGMPHSNMKQVFCTKYRLLYKLSGEFITFGT